MTPNALRYSLVQAVRAHGLLREFVPAIGDLCDRLPYSFGLDPLVLLGADVVENYPLGRHHLGIRLLTLRGYPPEVASDVVKLLYEQFPHFSPEAAMLSPKAVLTEEYGMAMGSALATTLVDPAAQPVLHAMLFSGRGQKAEPTVKIVERECGLATLRSGAMASLSALKNPPLTWDLHSMEPLAHYEGRRLYEKHSGGSEPFPSRVIVPLHGAYDELANYPA